MDEGELTGSEMASAVSTLYHSTLYGQTCDGQIYLQICLVQYVCKLLYYILYCMQKWVLYKRYSESAQ